MELELTHLLTRTPVRPNAPYPCDENCYFGLPDYKSKWVTVRTRYEEIRGLTNLLPALT